MSRYYTGRQARTYNTRLGMSTLLTILATATRSPGWVAVPLLFVLTLFTVAVVSINVVFHRRSW